MTTFKTTLHASGKNTTGIIVPEEVVTDLNGGQRPLVQVTINGSYTYPSAIAKMGGEFMISVSAEHRAGAGIAAGDPIEVAVVLDTTPRTVEVPADLAQALAAVPAAEAFFAGLSNSNKKWHVLQVEGAKTEETRQRRIAKSVEMLTEGRAR